MTKTCSNCSKDKEENLFATSPRTNKLLKVCQTCWDIHYASMAKSVEHHRDKQRTEGRATRKKQIARNRLFLIEILKGKACIDCGYDNFIALELDHRDPNDKYDSVTRMVNDGTTLERIKQEAAKCDIVCSNCHAIRTAKSCNSWRLTIL